LNPVMEIIEKSYAEPTVVRPPEISFKRLSSLRTAVGDFCKRSQSLGKAMSTWSFILKALQGQESADVWWSVDDDEVTGFVVCRVYQDFDGQWTAYVLFGWSKSGTPTKVSRARLNAIINQYEINGVERFQFTTRRHADVFQRWAGDRWNPVGTLFELRREHHG